MSFQTILAIGSGGFLGAILRAYISTSLSSRLSFFFPFGTLSVNLLGSVILGALYAFFMYTSIFSNEIKSFLSVGLLGAFTTYSTFALESFLLFKDSLYLYAALNIILNVFGTIIFLACGYKIAEFFLK